MTIFGFKAYIRDLVEIGQPRDDEDDWETQSHTHQPSHHDHSRFQALSRSLRINLVLCNVTVWIMFVAGVIECAFAALMQDDLKTDDDGYGSSCESYYVYPGYLEDTTDKCNRLYAWTYIMIFGASFSLVRTLMNALPVHGQNHMTLQYERGGTVDNWLTPSRSYAIRTSFSAMAFVLHIISAIMLGVSPVITDPVPTAPEYHIMYILCLSLVCVATVMTGQQTFATGLASWRLREPKQIYTEDREMEAPRPKMTGPLSERTLRTEPFSERTFLKDITLDR